MMVEFMKKQATGLEVLVPPERVSEARALFLGMGKQLGQRAIYLEVRESGEIIDLD
jgi:hypothetical protein